MTVYRVLSGPAKGQILLTYKGAYDESPESGGHGPLQVGKRYLFFGGSNPEGTEYYVSAGTGTILIEDKKQEAELVKAYQPLIAEADRREEAVIISLTAWAGAQIERKGVAQTASISPEQGPPGTEITVTGENFGFREVMIVVGKDTDSAEFADVRVEDGSFKKDVRVPNHTPSGTLTIVVGDEQGNLTELTFKVTKELDRGSRCLWLTPP